jgi:hypothetical protein
MAADISGDREMWCFDSWAVLDGLAFVSFRKPETIDSETTVFLSVPDLEPVPIGRISTALRAQRAGFQDGFRSPNGREFEFENLEQIKEVIRRAYLGGGLAPVPAPLEGPPVSPFRRERERPPAIRPTRDAGRNYYEEELHRLGSARKLPRDFRPLGDSKRRADLLGDVYEGSEYIHEYLQAFGTATLLEFVKTNTDRLHLPGPREVLQNWTHLLYLLGFSQDNRLGGYELDAIARDIIHHFYRPRIPLSFDKAILFHIPCPLRRNWSRHIQTLGHKLLLPLVDREYYSNNRELAEFIPALFCAMIIVINPQLTVSNLGELRFDDYRRLLGRACEWLLHELPRVDLPEEVEMEISKFAWRRLELNQERRDTDPGFAGEADILPVGR